MFNMKTLDTVIALIVVILMLSLIVQSIQSLLKKWFKLKSAEILRSLDDLFKYAGSEELAKITSLDLVEALKKELVKIGRVTIRGNPIMDSIAKEDLVKLVEKLIMEKALKAADKFKADETKFKEELEKAKLSVAQFQEQIHTWYDATMQSFEERHARYMKTVALVVSIFVVILLNANFFDIYKNISTNDALRAAIIEQRSKIETDLNAPAVTAVDKATMEKQRADLDSQLAQASLFGITPLKMEDVKHFFADTGPWDDDKKSFGEQPWYAAKMVSGWAIMVMLLSVGAPFWQDALESLFGIKNLLRQKSGTKNAEDQGGQTKP